MRRKICSLLLSVLLLISFVISPRIVLADDCTDTAPASAPNLYSVTSSGTAATLYFAPPANGYNGFAISYGLTGSADNYSTSFQQGVSGTAVQYTINDLAPDTTYYFKVRATNGCASGEWSNVMSTTSDTSVTDGSSGATITPVATVRVPVTGPWDGALMTLGAGALLAGGLGIFLRYK